MDHLKKQKNFDIIITEKRKEVFIMTYNNDAEGCAIICVFLILSVAVWFGMPWVCLMGWKPIAAAFSLPAFGYWDWFWMSAMIRWLFKGSSSNGLNLERKRK